MIRIALLTMLAVPAAWAQPDGGVSPGWFLSGSGAPGYEAAPLEAAACGGGGARLRALGGTPSGPVAVLQTLDARSLRGVRIRFSAAVSARGVTGWAGLVARAGGPGLAAPVGDDMSGHPVRGTLACVRRSVVVQVPPEAAELTVGAVLEGPGELEVSGLALEQVGEEVPVSAGPGTSDGRVGSVAFDQLAIKGVDATGVPVNIVRRAPGVWVDEASETEAQVDGERVTARSLEVVDPSVNAYGAHGLPLGLSGDFSVRHARGATLIDGQWGTALGRHPVRIVLTPSQLDMQWGAMERHLKVERAIAAAAIPRGCRSYAAGPEAGAERLLVCGSVLGPTPPPAQTVLAFLMTGFHRP